MNTKTYKRKNIPVQHSMLQHKSDESCSVLQSIPDMIQILKKQHQKKNDEILKVTNLQSLQKLYKSQIDRLQTKIKQLTGQQPLQNSVKNTNKQLVKILLLSAQIDRLRKYILQRDGIIIKVQQQLSYIKLNHLEQISRLKLTITNKSKQQLNNLKTQFQKRIIQIKQLHQQHLLELEKKYVVQNIIDKQTKNNIQIMKLQTQKLRKWNQKHIDKIKQQELQIRRLQKNNSQSVYVSEKSKQSKSQKQNLILKDEITKINNTKQDLQKKVLQLQSDNLLNSSVYQQQISKLKDKVILLQDQIKVLRQLVKLQPRNDHKQQNRRGDQSLEISLQNSNFNEKQQRIKIQELIRQLKSQIQNNEKELKFKNQEIDSLKKQIQQQIEQINKNQELIQFKNQVIKADIQKINDLMQYVPDFSNQDNQTQQLTDKIHQKDNKIQLLEKTLKQRTNTLQQKTQEVDQLQYSLRDYAKKLAKKEQDYQKMKAQFQVVKQMFENQLQKNISNNDQHNDEQDN